MKKKKITLQVKDKKLLDNEGVKSWIEKAEKKLNSKRITKKLKREYEKCLFDLMVNGSCCIKDGRRIRIWKEY